MIRIDKSSIKLSAASGEEVHQDFFVSKTSDGELVARLTPPVPGATVRLQARRLEEIPLTEQEIEDLERARPPFVPFPTTRRDWVEHGSASEGEPLELTGGMEVLGFVDFRAEPGQSFGAQVTELVIDASNAKSARIPVTFTVGSASVEVLSQPVNVFIGAYTPFRMRVSLPAGLPPTTLTISSIGGRIGVVSQSVTLSGGQSATVESTIGAGYGTAVGRHTAVLDVFGLSEEQMRVPFEVTAVHLTPSSPSASEEQKEEMKRELERQHQRMGGVRGPLGISLSEAEYIDALNEAKERYAGGELKHAINALNQFAVEKLTHVTIRYLGFKCLDESNKFSGSEEPYFIIGAVSGNGSNTVLIGPYGDVDEGQIRSDPIDIVGQFHRLVPPVMIGIIAMENDSGNPVEVLNKVRIAVQRVADRFHEGAGSFVMTPTSTFVVPGWLRDAVIGWIPESISAILGMGDDNVGRWAHLLFDDRQKLIAREQMPVVGGEQPLPAAANLVVPLGTESEGRYNLYFDVDLVVDPRTRPASEVMAETLHP